MHLSDAINKGQLSAYQRWEMTSFEEKPIPTLAPAPAPVIRRPPPPPPVSPEEIALIKEQAREEGYAQGLEESHQIGYETGLTEGQQELQLQQDAFGMLAKQFVATRRVADQVLAQDILDFALHLSRAMFKQALNIDRTLIIPLIEHAIASMPSIQQPAQLFLHPHDAELVRHKLGSDLTAAGWSIQHDLHLHPGDCRIETAKNQLDASLATRWEQLTAALGRDIHWLSSSEKTSGTERTNPARTSEKGINDGVNDSV